MHQALTGKSLVQAAAHAVRAAVRSMQIMSLW
jgi:hypothetical protein